MPRQRRRNRRRNLRLGFNVGFSPDPERDAQLAGQSGGKFLRFPVHGPAPDFRALDKFAQAASRAGIKPLISLAGHAEDVPQTKRERQQFARNAAEIARRYDTAGIEVWNEPNSFNFGGAMRPKDYAKLLAATKRQVRRTGANDKIIAGNTAPIRQGSNLGAEWTTWLKQVKKHAPKKGLEWAIHSYPGVGRRKRGANQTIRQAKRARRITGQRPWVTEVGFSRARGGDRAQTRRFRRAFKGLSRHAKAMNVFALGETGLAATDNPDVFEQWAGMALNEGDAALEELARLSRRSRRRRLRQMMVT